MSYTTIHDGITQGAFVGLKVFGGFHMISSNISGGIGKNVFASASIASNLDMQSATISGGIADAAFLDSVIWGDFLLVESVFIDIGIEAGVFLGWVLPYSGFSTQAVPDSQMTHFQCRCCMVCKC